MDSIKADSFEDAIDKAVDAMVEKTGEDRETVKNKISLDLLKALVNRQKASKFASGLILEFVAKCQAEDITPAEGLSALFVEVAEVAAMAIICEFDDNKEEAEKVYIRLSSAGFQNAMSRCGDSEKSKPEPKSEDKECH